LLRWPIYSKANFHQEPYPQAEANGAAVTLGQQRQPASSFHFRRAVQVLQRLAPVVPRRLPLPPSCCRPCIRCRCLIRQAAGCLPNDWLSRRILPRS
jgi:hypothetical protein